MSKYTNVHLVSLEERFKPGTIGNEMIYVREQILLKPFDFEALLTQEETETSIPIKDLDMFYAFADPDEPDINEVLRKLGVYDSTDPRSCIRKKRR
ncbi:hypothetical protein J4429_03685 [Candidatus Pacearchaeota archaeon]|nr:hypothetical protein [Candidatus Pacearchaeota archaeon]